MSVSTEERRRGGIATSQVEYQMRFRDLIARAAEPAGAEVVGPVCGPYLTVSREAGSRGAEVAQRVGDRLGWSVLDRDLVDRLAEDLELEPGVLELLDERRANWLSETLLNLFNSRLVAQHGYIELLGKVLAIAASSGPVVIVGRGAHLILPPDRGFRVRVVAPRDDRVRWIAARDGIDSRSAERRLDEIDAGRHGFVARNFRHNPAEPSLYDLTLNTATLGIDGSVELVVEALKLRGLATAR